MKKKILIIDDDIIYQQIIRKLLCSDYKVMVAGDSDETIELLNKSGFPDLIIADLNLPGINGLELIRILKEKFDFNETKILVISGMDDDKLRSKLIQIGVSEILTKPIERKVLREKVDCLMGKAFQSKSQRI